MHFEHAWPRLRARYGERFRRIWRYHLLSSAGAFRARFMQLYQIVMTRPGTRQPECRLSERAGSGLESSTLRLELAAVKA